MAALRLNRSTEMGINLPVSDTIEALMEDKKPRPKSPKSKTSTSERAQDQDETVKLTK